MDRPLKERLVGATVLVALMIVVVPLFLDGPAHTGADTGNTVSEAVSLPPAGRPAHVISLDGDAPASTAPRAVEPAVNEPPPATAAKPGERVSPQPEAVLPKSAPAKPVLEKPSKQPPPVAPAPDAGWAVQVGSFSSEKNARGLAGDLRQRDYNAFHVRKNINGRVLYRVLIGPEQDRERADALASRLRADGLPTTIVRHP